MTTQNSPSQNKKKTSPSQNNAGGNIRIGDYILNIKIGSSKTLIIAFIILMGIIVGVEFVSPGLIGIKNRAPEHIDDPKPKPTSDQKEDETPISTSSIAFEPNTIVLQIDNNTELASSSLLPIIHKKLSEKGITVLLSEKSTSKRLVVGLSVSQQEVNVGYRKVFETQPTLSIKLIDEKGKLLDSHLIQSNPIVIYNRNETPLQIERWLSFQNPLIPETVVSKIKTIES